MKHCIKCNDVIEHLSDSMLRKIKNSATEFKHSDKEEMHKIKISALQFSNKKIPVLEFRFYEQGFFTGIIFCGSIVFSSFVLYSSYK